MTASRGRGSWAGVAAIALVATLAVPQAAGALEGDLLAEEARDLVHADSEQPGDIALYCAAIADPALEARAAWQTQALLEIETRIEARLVELARMRVELEAALARREEHLRQAQDGIVAIYARMRPDAAAAQLAALDDEMASAVIARLGPRQASAILNEMEPGRAAQLARTATETARHEDAREEQAL